MAITEVKDEAKIKKEIAKREKKVLPVAKFSMPEELGGREIHVLKKKIPSKLYKMIESGMDEANFELIETMIPQWLVKPKVTKKNLYDIFEDFAEITIALGLIIEENTITEDRIQQLRKKVKRL